MTQSHTCVMFHLITPFSEELAYLPHIYAVGVLMLLLIASCGVCWCTKNETDGQEEECDTDMSLRFAAEPLPPSSEATCVITNGWLLVKKKLIRLEQISMIEISCGTITALLKDGTSHTIVSVDAVTPTTYLELVQAIINASPTAFGGK